MLPLPEGKASQKYCTLGMGASGPWVGMLVYITSPVHAQPLSSFQIGPHTLNVLCLKLQGLPSLV